MLGDEAISQEKTIISLTMTVMRFDEQSPLPGGLRLTQVE